MNFEPSWHQFNFAEPHKSFQVEKITNQMTTAGTKLYINRQTLNFRGCEDSFENRLFQETQDFEIKKQEEDNISKTKVEIHAKHENPKKEEIIKYENLKGEEDAEYESPSIKSEESSLCEEQSPQIKLLLATPEKKENRNSSLVINIELGKIVNYILSNMGKLPEAEIQNFRNRYQEYAVLLQVFDKLVMKYYSARKSKEDIIRYIIRRSFKTIKASIIRNEKVSPQNASLLLYEKYFKINLNETQDQTVDHQNNKKKGILGFFTPGTKKSKTINRDFVKEVFSSEGFCEEYKRFLALFHNILSYDNNKKKIKFVRFLVDCVQKDCLWKIGKYNRLPWLESWIENTKDIAKHLMSKKSVYKWKKHKKT